MTLSFEVHFTEDAEKDIRDILQYTREHWGEYQHDDYSAVLESAFNRLSRFPFSGKVLTSQFPKRRMLPVREHLILYVVEDDVVTIAHLIHKRQDIALFLTE